MGKILAIDYGKVRHGLAISDETKTFARAHKVVIGIEALKKEIENIYEIYNIEKILLGISKKSDGELGEIGVLALSFADYLNDNFDFQIGFIDESMTTKEAEKILREMKISHKKYKGQIDKFAAEIMLQEFLNTLNKKNS